MPHHEVAVARPLYALLQFFDRAGDEEFSVFCAPHRNRGSPETGARDRPIAGALKPFAEAPVADISGNPSHFFVFRDHLVSESGHFYEPRRGSVIQERRIAAPAVRIAVRDLFFLEQKSGVCEMFDDLDIRFLMVVFRLHRHAGEIRYFRLECPVERDVVDDRQSFTIREREIVFSKGGRDMHNTGTIRRSYKICGIHFPRFFFVKKLCVFVIGKNRFVAKTHEVLAMNVVVNNFYFSCIKKSGDALSRDDVKICLLFYSKRCVANVVTDCQRDISRKRPWRRRPCENVRGIFRRVGTEFLIRFQKKFDRDRKVDDILVPLVYFEIRERGAAARA